MEPEAVWLPTPPQAEMENEAQAGGRSWETSGGPRSPGGRILAAEGSAWLMSLLSFLSPHRVQGKMLLLQGGAASRRCKYHLEGVPETCPCVPRPFRRKLCPLPTMPYLHTPPSFT